MSKYILLLVVLIIGIGTRVYLINSHGLSLDEKTSVRSALGIKDISVPVIDNSYDQIRCNYLKTDDCIINEQPFTSKNYWDKNTLNNVKNAVVLDNSNNLSFAFALHFFIKLFGLNFLQGRCFSIIIGLLTLLLSFYIGQIFFSHMYYSLCFTLLLSLNFNLIYTSQLLRPYAFTTFFVCLSCCLFFTILFKNNQHWLNFCGYLLATTMLLFAHHMALYIVLVQIFILLIFLSNKHIWGQFILCYLAIFSCYTLWVFVYGAEGFEILKNKNVYFYNKVVANPLAPWPGTVNLKNISVGIINYLNILFGTNYSSLNFKGYIILLLLFIPVSIIATALLKSKNENNKSLIVSLLLMVIACPLFSVLFALKSHTMMPFSFLYASFMIPIGLMLLVLSFQEVFNINGIYRKFLLLFSAIQILFIFFSLPTAYNQSSTKEDEDNQLINASNIIKTNYKKNDLVVYPSWNDAQLANLFLRDRMDILQDVDTTLINKIVILRNGKYIEIFKFSNAYKRYWTQTKFIGT